MRRALWIAGALAAMAWSNTSQAQTGTLSNDDPFFLYYGYFLPRQAAIANSPNVNDTINASVAARQSYATTNRGSLYDPNGNYGTFDNYSSVDPYSDNGSARARAGRRGGAAGRGMPTTNINGRGPALYYNRAAEYHPGLRNGQGPNRNLYVPGKGVRRGGGGAGMPNPAGGMNPSPGPR